MTTTEKEKRFDDIIRELPPPLGLRPATVADVPGIYTMYAAREERLHGQVSITESEIDREMRSGPIRMFVAGDPSNASIDMVAAISLRDSSEFNHARADCSLDCDPAKAMEALRWTLEVSRRTDPLRVTTSGTDDADTDKVARLESLGGSIIRRFAEMSAPLDPTGTHAAPPTVPDNVEVRNLTSSDEDWRIIYDVTNTSFLDHFGNRGQDHDAFVAEFKVWIDDMSLCWLASVRGEPASVLMGETRPHDGYIATLGTLREFRKLGLGKLLLLTSFATFASRGLMKASLHVDQTNPTGAVGLYESVGMTMVQRSVSYSWPPLEPVAD